MDQKLFDAVRKGLNRGEIGATVKMLEGRLAKEKSHLFKGLIGTSFSNSPASVLKRINGFIKTCEKDFDIEAIYLEMNGFDINTDRWYFDFLGYSDYNRDPKDFEWLCDWDSERQPDVTLNGLKKIQRDFDKHLELVQADDVEFAETKKLDATQEIACLLVMAKFVALIESALKSGALAKPIPVLASAHGFTGAAIAGRFKPAKNQR